MKYITTKIKGKDLKPGDLFSTVGPEFWETGDASRDVECIGHKVYIRTEAPPETVEDGESFVYKITVVL